MKDFVKQKVKATIRRGRKNTAWILIVIRFFSLSFSRSDFLHLN